jgi:SSS family solute:Na+ symporter
LNIPALDLGIIVVYLLGILVVGLLSVRKTRLTGDMYFLAGRSLKWPVVGAALFASNISTIHLVGLAEGGFKHGLVIGNFEWMATFTLIILALVFTPFYFKTKISTLPEFLEKRYSPATRGIVAFMAIMAALLIHIGISLYAGAALFEEFFGTDVLLSIGIISLITAVYTVVGGLKAVVVTETIQTVILLLGAVSVTLFALFALPEKGIHSVGEFKQAVNAAQQAAEIQSDRLSMLHGSNAQGYAWYAFFLGYPILGLWYWCSDQTIVQRVLGARDELQGQRGALFAGLLKILPVFIMVFPGVLGLVLYQDKIVDAKFTLPVMINELIPPGMKGLIAAALLAALMSTIAAALNSTGTLVAMDIVGRLRPRTTDRQRVLIGRVSAVVVMFLAMIWSTQGDKFDSIFEAINKMPAEFLAPPIATVFFWGVFWRRGTKEAALTTLIAGFSLGLVAFAVDVPLIPIYEKTVLKDGVETVVSAQLITDIWGVPFMMQAWWGFCICTGIYVVTSLLTPRPAKEQVRESTWEHPLQVIFRGKLTGLGDPRAIAGLLLLLMGILYWVFH